MLDIGNLAQGLSERGADAASGFPFEVNPLPGDVVQIVVEDREELPIFVSASEEQILCIAYLFKSEEVKDALRAEMESAMLAVNIPMPLSSFARLDDQYVIFGALSVNSSLDDVIHELEVLSANAVDALEAMSEFLN